MYYEFLMPYVKLMSTVNKHLQMKIIEICTVSIEIETYFCAQAKNPAAVLRSKTRPRQCERR
jgi:hypothetical protein